MSAPQHSGKVSLFATTRWSVVLAARDGDGRDATVAMETLCGTYWRALYAYGRRLGLAPHDAEDATQGFFRRLLEKDYLQAVQAERGPFRSDLPKRRHPVSLAGGYGIREAVNWYQDHGKPLSDHRILFPNRGHTRIARGKGLVSRIAPLPKHSRDQLVRALVDRLNLLE